MRLKEFDENEMYISEVIHFVNCVKKNKKTICTAEDGAKTLEIALAIKKASEIKKMVKL